MKKLKRTAGETLAEMLLSMLIISLGMLILAGAVTASAHVNQKAREMAGINQSRESLDTTLGEIRIKVELGGTTISDDIELGVLPLANGIHLYFYDDGDS